MKNKELLDKLISMTAKHETAIVILARELRNQRIKINEVISIVNELNRYQPEEVVEAATEYEN